MPFKARTHKHSNKVVICMSNYLVLGQNVLSALRENPTTKTQLILLVSVAANDLFGRLLWCGTEAIIEKTTIDEAVITCVLFHTKTENKQAEIQRFANILFSSCSSKAAAYFVFLTRYNFKRAS